MDVNPFGKYTKEELKKMAEKRARGYGVRVPKSKKIKPGAAPAPPHGKPRPKAETLNQKKAREREARQRGRV
jgi:hypothetical protein